MTIPKYKYTALGNDNQKHKGVMEARSEADLRNRLRQMSLVPVRISEIDEKQGVYRLKPNEVAEFSRQLGNMLGSGITVVRALDILLQRDVKPKTGQIYSKLYRDLQQGMTLSEAMRLQSGAFPELLVNMYASGEASGQLEQVCSKMAVQYEKEHRLNGKVKSAMTYPLILLIATILVVMLVFTIILPQFFSIFVGMELPGITKAVIAISKFLQTGWYYVIIAMLLIIAVFRMLMQIDNIRFHVDRIILRILKVGKLLKIIYTARFSRTLASLYVSGVPMLTALDISSTIIGNLFIARQFGEVMRLVRNGRSLSESLAGVDGFDNKLPMTILIGEETGRLDAMLESVADTFEYEAEIATERLVRLIEPVMIVVMAGVVGFIMLAVMLPIFALNEGIQSGL